MTTPPDDHYPAGSVRGLIETDLLTPPTAEALRARMLAPIGKCLDVRARAALAAVGERLLPQPDRDTPIDLAAIVEDRLAGGVGDGWRYDTMPDDATAMQRGLIAIDASALAWFGAGVADLDTMSCDLSLAAVQRGDVQPEIWGDLDPVRFFEELLVAVTEAYYAHPLAAEEIGYLGMADARGWADVGLGARAAHEPVPL